MFLTLLFYSILYSTEGQSTKDSLHFQNTKVVELELGSRNGPAGIWRDEQRKAESQFVMNLSRFIDLQPVFTYRAGYLPSTHPFMDHYPTVSGL